MAMFWGELAGGKWEKRGCGRGSEEAQHFSHKWKTEMKSGEKTNVFCLEENFAF